MKVTLLVPTMNEVNAIRLIMPRVKREWVDEILLVDGGSDGTYEYAVQQGYTAIKQRSKGLPGAYQEAVAAASGDIIVTFSPDGNSIPELIPAVVAKAREGYDMVIVSRYLGGAKSADDTWITALGNKMFTGAINVAFGGKYTDTLVMFRAWKKEVFQHLRFNAGRAGIEPHLSIVCAKLKLKVAEIPGDEPKRIADLQKMHPVLNGTAIVWLILRELFS